MTNKPQLVCMHVHLIAISRRLWNVDRGSGLSIYSITTSGLRNASHSDILLRSRQKDVLMVK